MMMKSSKSFYWRDRNNSANISAILQPDYYQKQSLETVATTTTLIENTNETCNFCYCRKLSDDKPKLFQHPLECYQNNHEQQHYKHCSDYDDDNDDDGSPRRSINLRQDLIQRDFIDRSCNNHKFDDDNDDKQNLSDLESWRQSHYFETHSVDDLLKKENKMPCCCQQQQHPQHTCIHQFKLNERNLPVAVNMDQYGLSRCIICNRPMKNVRISCNDDDDNDKNPIYLDDDDNIKIQLILNNDDYNTDKQDLVHPSIINYSNNQLKRPEYSNTLALRYQKGVAWP